MPAAVVLARETAHVQHALRVASRLGVPVVPQGARSGLSGAANAIDGCIVLSTREDEPRSSRSTPRTGSSSPSPASSTPTSRARSPSTGLFYPPDPSQLGVLLDRRQPRRRTPAACAASSTASRPTTCSDSRSCSPTRRGAAHRPAHRQGRRRATTSPGCSSAARARSASSPRSRWRCGRRPQPPRTGGRRSPTAARPAARSPPWSPRGLVPSLLEFMDRTSLRAVNDLPQHGDLPDDAARC